VASINWRLSDMHIPGISLLLPLLDKQLEYCLPIQFAGHAIKNMPVAFNIPASDELIHVGLGS
jgi:hypothetical protein